MVRLAIGLVLGLRLVIRLWLSICTKLSGAANVMLQQNDLISDTVSRQFLDRQFLNWVRDRIRVRVRVRVRVAVQKLTVQIQ